MSEKTLFLIDGSSLFYRAYFALMRNPLFNSKGENTTATYGFVNQLIRLMQKQDVTPDYLSVVFDTKQPTFRHKRYPAYKATREKMPEEMAAQYPRIVELTHTMGIKVIELPGWEADDVIGTLAKRAASEGFKVFMVTSDKDYMQLVENNILMYNPWGKKGVEILDPKGVENKVGITPAQITDYLALTGDSSDNIPGVAGVGPVTALKLLQQFESFDNIYANLDKVSKPALREKLEKNRENALLSKELVTIDIDAPLDITPEELNISEPDKESLVSLLKELEFNKIIVQLGTVYDNFEHNGPSIESENKSYHLIKDRAQFEDLLSELKSHSIWAFDTETNGLKPFDSHIIGLSFSYQRDEGYYLPLTDLPDLSAEEMLRELKPLFADPALKKCGQNIKFDVLMLYGHGIKVKGIFFDTMIAHYLLHSGSRGHKLDNIAKQYLNYEMIPIEELIGKRGKSQKNMSELSPEEIYRYAAEDAEITFALVEVLEKELKKNNLHPLFTKLEMPLVEVLTAMEINGVKIDTDLLRSVSDKIEITLKETIKKIYEIAGEEFNINSTQQLGKIIYDKLEIHKELGLKRIPKTAKGGYSTSESALEKMAEHKLINLILQYRKLTKLKNTYLDPLPSLISKKTGRLHASFNQTVTATGRLSSSDPNLQNIPIRTELGKEIRKAFIPETANNVILSADYSQIELRIMAELSGDPSLKAAFSAGKDIHTSTAAMLMGIPEEEVTSDHRRKAKEINFGILYGMNRYGLAKRLGISAEEAQQMINNYFAGFPRVLDYTMRIITFATRNRFVETMMGRRRYIPEIDSSNRNVRENAERQAINTVIQGSAADLIKMAMIKIQKYIEQNSLESKMLIQIHDELLFEVPKAEVDIMKKAVKEIMSTAYKIEVPLEVDLGVGKNWLEAHE